MTGTRLTHTAGARAPEWPWAHRDGFRPDTGTALAAVCTRRFRARDPFVATAHALLADS